MVRDMDIPDSLPEGFEDVGGSVPIRIGVMDPGIVVISIGEGKDAKRAALPLASALVLCHNLSARCLNLLLKGLPGSENVDDGPRLDLPGM
jgi:hypothetical protein